MHNINGVIMSIKPQYAQAIITGEKQIELRKRIPKVGAGDIIVFYESLPIQRVTFYCVVEEIVSMSPKKLWETYSNRLGITKKEYDKYFYQKTIAYGIKLQTPQVFATQKKIGDISEELLIPQSYRYIPPMELKKILQWKIR